MFSLDGFHRPAHGAQYDVVAFDLEQVFHAIVPARFIGVFKARIDGQEDDVGARPQSLDDLQPVSYTHLDVYKRQIWLWR